MAKTDKEEAAEVAQERQERYTAALEVEREGYEQRLKGAQTDEQKAAAQARLDAVDAELKGGSTKAPRGRRAPATENT